MRSYLSLVPISARMHRRQSRMTRICIILAVFLVTSIFSMSEMWSKSEVTTMRHSHGNWHIAVENVSDSDAERILENDSLSLTAWYDALNTNGDQDYTVSGTPAAVIGTGPTYLSDMMQYPLEGAYPQSDSEIALSVDAKEQLHLSCGDTITLHTPNGEQNYTISGFYADDSAFNRLIDGFCVYLNQSAFEMICNQNHITPAPQYYLRFGSERGLAHTIADFKQQYGLADANVTENTGLLSALGASSSKTMNGFYRLALVCFVIILIAGVFMISGCLNSTVAQRTQFFGMMRCIGASKQQIVRFVRLEALSWCTTAVPIGCALGTLTCWILCLILRLLVKGEWADMPLFAIGGIGIVSGAVVGVVTVFIAAHAPAMQAAKVSPIAAISGNADAAPRIGCAAKSRFFKVETALGMHHAISAKKNLVLMTGSFALMIVLFLVFSAGLDLVHRLLPSDSDFTPDITIASADTTNSLDRDLLAQLEQLPGVQSTFGLMLNANLPVEVNGKPSHIDLFSESDSMLKASKKSIASGKISKVYGDSAYAISVYNQSGSLSVGDKITINGQSIEIEAVTSEGVGSVSGVPNVVCSEQTFMRLTGNRNYANIGILLDKNAPESTVQRIYALAGNNTIADNREDKHGSNSSYWVFRLAAYGFLCIISLITVLNIMNSVSMGVSARTRQYGVMRAVGMDGRQITRMIAAEAVTYAVSGTVVGFALGLPLHHLIYTKIILTHFGGRWPVPVLPMSIIVLLVALSCVLAVHAPAKRIREMAITETLTEL